MFRITIIRRIIAEQALGTGDSRKSSAKRRVLWDTYPWYITCQAAVWRQSRIVLALAAFAAAVWPRREASTGRILVLERAVAGASVEVDTGRTVGDALHVKGAGRNLETASPTDFASRRGEGDGHGEKD